MSKLLPIEIAYRTNVKWTVQNPLYIQLAPLHRLEACQWRFSYPSLIVAVGIFRHDQYKAIYF